MLVVAAYGFDLALLTDHGALVDQGPAAAGLLRLGGIVDMVGYLALAPVVIYLHGRLSMALPDDMRRLGVAALVTAASRTLSSLACGARSSCRCWPSGCSASVGPFVPKGDSSHGQVLVRASERWLTA